MKVSTDSILFGSWCNWSGLCSSGQPQKILDIGTGTGILSLMLAQKTPDSTDISAIEIDSDAFEQAKANVEASPWPERVNVFHQSLQEFVETSDSHFDVIISNPPWFEFAASQAHNAYNQRRDASRIFARQQLGLTLDVLMTGVVNLLKSEGQLFLILPVQAEQFLCSNLEERGLQVYEWANVFATAKHAAYCHLWHLQKGIMKDKPQPETIVIKQDNNQYTSQFKKLCKDYYLKF